MATTTTNLGLTKPAYADAADVAVFNTNMDLIDSAVKALQDTTSTHTSQISSLQNSVFAYHNLGYNQDLNNLTETGVYSVVSATHTPLASDTWGCLVNFRMDNSANYITQLFIPLDAFNIYVRICNGGTWSDWTVWQSSIVFRSAENRFVAEMRGGTLSGKPRMQFKMYNDMKYAAINTYDGSNWSGDKMIAQWS